MLSQTPNPALRRTPATGAFSRVRTPVKVAGAAELGRSALRRLLGVIPIITKHYGVGMLGGIGFGLFLAGILIESGVVTDDG